MTNRAEAGISLVPNGIERAIVIQTHRAVPERLARERAIVIPHDPIADFEAHQLKSLGDYRMRYNSDGQIFIDRFNKTGIQIELPEFPSSVDIGFDSVEVVKRLWPCIPDVETAIRYTRHIADEYDRKEGQQTLSLLAIHRVIRDVSLALQKPVEERPTWEELESKVFLAIDSLRLDTARDNDKVELGKTMASAVSKDKKGRENPGRTRMKLAHMYPKITSMLLRNEHKHNKYRYLESVLYQERERDRIPFVELSREIKMLSTMNPRDREAINLKKRIRENAYKNLAPSKIRVAPYVQLGAVSRFLMFGKNTPEDEKKLAGYIGPDLAKETAEAGSYYDLHTHEEQLKRLIAIADYINGSLEEADQNLPNFEQAA